MKLKQPFGPKISVSALSAGTAGELPAAQGRKQNRRQMEELKMQVLELAEHQMEVTVRVLKNWIAGN